LVNHHDWSTRFFALVLLLRTYGAFRLSAVAEVF